MRWWNRDRKRSQPAQAVDTGTVQKRKKVIKGSPPVALEVKLLAIDGAEILLLGSPEMSLPGLSRVLRVRDCERVSSEESWEGK